LLSWSDAVSSCLAALAPLRRRRRRRWRRWRRAGRRRFDHRPIGTSLGRRRRRRWWGWRRRRCRRLGRLAPVEVVNQAREYVVGRIIPTCGAGVIDSIYRERVVKVELGGAEILILDPGIEVRRQGIAQSRRTIECPGVVPVTGVGHPGPARAAPDISAEAPPKSLSSSALAST